MARDNGPRIGVLSGSDALAGLLASLTGQQEEKQPATLEQAKASFAKRLDYAMEPCEDPRHRLIEDSLQAMLRGLYKFDILPEPVAVVLAKVLAHEAMHSEDHGVSIGRLFSADTIPNALLIAGAVLRVKDLPETSGVRLSTGNYV